MLTRRYAGEVAVSPASSERDAGRGVPGRHPAREGVTAVASAAGSAARRQARPSSQASQGSQGSRRSPNTLLAKTICHGVGTQANIRLDKLGECVETGAGGESRWQVVSEFGVNDRDVAVGFYNVSVRQQ